MRGSRTAAPISAAIEVEIEAVGGEGDGVAPGPLYAPFTLPGERVRLAPGGARREVERILVASPDRVEPPCPHFGACGGCSLQHWAHAPYLAWKVERLAKTLLRERLEPEMLPAFAVGPGARRRVALHARRGGREVAKLGYKARGSWNLVEIEVCPIADARIQSALPALKRLAAPLFEHPKSAPTLHVTLTDEGLDIDISGVERKSGGLSGDARVRLAEAAAAADFARVTLDGEIAYQARSPAVRLGPARVVLPPGAFLQASTQSERAMADFVTEAVAGATRVADLHCGVGTFSFRLAQAVPVWAVDGSAPAIQALSAALASAPGLKPIKTEVRDLVRRPVLAQDLKAFDAAVFDPPRAGAAEQAAQLAQSKLARVIGVSCNPATFVRDARILVDAGFRLERVLPVDQFLWSPHVELVGVFSR